MIISNEATPIHQPLRSTVRVSDAAEIREFLDTAYGVRLRLRQSCAADAPLLHDRVDVGPVTVDYVDLPGVAQASPDPLNKVAAVWVIDGKLSTESGGLVGGVGTGEIGLLSQPDLPHSGQSETAHTTAVLLDPSLVAGVASGNRGSAQSPIRFSSFRPVDARAAQLWKDTVRYVKNCVLADEETATPLILGECSRLLAAITLATFPNTVVTAPATHDSTDTGPLLLRRAVDYMESNAADDIALADIAEAVHVTPRAVQYMFRRHLDTTPLQYLRQVRLDYAHRELIAADRQYDTVTQIAARWGFAHTGRFAVLYRRTFGQSPHETLRG